MNSKNNLEMNNKIEICNEGKKAYDIVLRDSFADLLDQMEFLEIEKKKVCIVTESNVAPIYLKEVCELISSKASKTITFSFEAGEKHKQLKTIEALYSTLFTSYAEEPSSTSVSSSSSQTTDPTNPPVEGDAMTGDGEIA